MPGHFNHPTEEKDTIIPREAKVYKNESFFPVSMRMNLQFTKGVDPSVIACNMPKYMNSPLMKSTDPTPVDETEMVYAYSVTSCNRNGSYRHTHKSPTTYHKDICKRVNPRADEEYALLGPGLQSRRCTQQVRT